MVRVIGGPASRARHTKVRAATKGYRGKNHSTFRLAMQAMMKAGMHAYVGRKQKKRDFRRLWISRISTALREQGERYSEIKNKWLHAKMDVDRKNLSEIAVNYPKVFGKLVDVAKKTKIVK
ncbi:50S ribosomal protein L20 [bacterium]|jgi:large subunit ribosomal protein L20|nr:50S ribosomal protein L20 [bacterium]MBT6831882.1 50S ribosomal protein L20 [bacterium]MBT6995972.1 50S ribosomal protein L20 [bacterium]MBT7772247.1 50S ribosomal protein L20 [bacterium]